MQAGCGAAIVASSIAIACPSSQAARTQSANPPRSDGAIAFDSSARGVELVNADGSGLKELANGIEPVWSPDGRWLAFNINSGDNNSGVFVVGSDGSNLRRLGGACCVYSWAPDSGRLAVIGVPSAPTGPDELHVVDVGGSDHVILREDDIGSVAWSRTGDEIAFVHNKEIRLIDPNGHGEHKLTDGAGGSLLWSPDGRELAFVTSSNDPFAPDNLVVVEADGSGSRTVIRDVSFPELAWSPDGSRLAFGGGVHIGGGDRFGTFIVNRDGSGLHQIDSGDVGTSSVSWSRDGSTLAVSRGSPADIWVIAADGSRKHRVTSGFRFGGDNEDPAWDPQSRRTSELGGRPVPAGLPVTATVTGHTVIAKRAITDLSADGPLVAFLTAGECANPQVWNTKTNAVTALDEPQCNGDLGECSARPCQVNGGEGSFEITVAGTRVAWIDEGLEGHTPFTSVKVASIARPEPATLTAGESDTSTAPFFLGHLHGQGGLLVFDAWTRSSAPRLWRIVGSPLSRERLIAKGAAYFAVASVSAGRIAVQRRDGTVAILNARGGPIRTFSFAHRPKEVQLQGRLLVVFDGSKVEAFDLTNGTLVHRLPASNIKLERGRGNVALYVERRQIHLVNLRTGSTSRIAVPGSGPVNAQLTAAGLAYSYNVGGAGRINYMRIPQAVTADR